MRKIAGSKIMMIKPLQACLIGMFLVFSAPTSSQVLSDRESLLLNNMQQEITACVAYFSIVQKCLENSNLIEAAKKYEELVHYLVPLATRIGPLIGMTQDGMKSRFDVELSEKYKMINGTCANISSLTVRNMDRCKQVIEKPDSILDEYRKSK